MSETWHLIGSKSIGSSHRENQTPCQDAFVCGVDQTSQFLLMAIADGAGSYLDSGFGAKFMCNRSIELFNDLIAENHLNDLSEKIEKNVIYQSIFDLKDYANSEEIPFRNFSSTFAFVAICPQFMYAAQIGDSRIAIQQELKIGHTVIGDLFSISSEYTNESDFTTDAVISCQTSIIPNPERIVGITAYTDGLDPVVVQRGNSFSGFFQPMFERIRKCHSQESRLTMEQYLSDFLSSEQVNSRTDDDKTLLIASRCPRCVK